jgi:hypothetical protein
MMHPNTFFHKPIKSFFPAHLSYREIDFKILTPFIPQAFDLCYYMLPFQGLMFFGYTTMLKA